MHARNVYKCKRGTQSLWSSFLLEWGESRQKSIPIPGPGKPLQPRIAESLFLPLALAFDVWVLSWLQFYILSDPFEKLSFFLSPQVIQSWLIPPNAFTEDTDVMGVISGHLWGSSGWHNWNPLLSTSSLASSLLVPSKVQVSDTGPLPPRLLQREYSSDFPLAFPWFFLWGPGLSLQQGSQRGMTLPLRGHLEMSRDNLGGWVAGIQWMLNNLKCIGQLSQQRLTWPQV